jgi:hypothetical protein
MKIQGGCHCGFITYEAEVDPEGVGICHCTDCQTMSGSAFRVVVPSKSADFKLLTGKPKTYVKTAESGNKRAQVFCPECGTHLYATSPTDPNAVIGIRAGTTKQRGQLTPKRQVWCRSQIGWLSDLPNIRRVEKQA